MRIACIQPAAAELAHAVAAFDHQLMLVAQAAQAGAALVLLPECAYPAYYLGRADIYQADMPDSDWALARLAAAARRHQLWLAAGIALPDRRLACLRNAAVLLNDRGEVVGQTNKRFLWHFDARWFWPGETYPVYPTPWGPVGLMICADGRLPEIARLLTLAGARLLLQPTAWVTTGPDRVAWTNPQPAYLIPTRALENGVYIACASKVGSEGPSIRYCGRSRVIGPDGTVLAETDSQGEAIIYADIDPATAPGPPVVRRPALYHALTWPTDRLPVTRAQREPVRPAEAVAFVAVAQFSADDAVTWRQEAATFVTLMSQQAADLVVLPGAPPGVTPAEVAALSADGPAVVTAVVEPDGGAGGLYAAGGALMLHHRQTHGPGGPVGDQPCPVVTSPMGRLGLLLGLEALVPEVARSLMLRGADTLVWLEETGLPMHLAISRAVENRLFLLRAPLRGTPPAAIFDPQGQALAMAEPGQRQVISAQVAWLNARLKTMAPGTDVVAHRQPEQYAPLTDGRLDLPAQ